MNQIILSHIDVTFGIVKGVTIDRKSIKNDILTSVARQRRLGNNPAQPAYHDYAVPFSQPLQWFHDYVRDHFKTEFKSCKCTQSPCGYPKRSVQGQV